MNNKFLIASLAFFVIFFAKVNVASAHLVGQPPFFKVDGVFSGYYPISSTSIDNFPLPQDISPKNYLVNQTINFEIEKSQLPVPAEIVNKTKFLWEYGDGEKAEGLKNSHAYKNKGSYLLTIYVDTSAVEKGSTPQLIQSIFLNILPDENYQLPKAVIKVDGKYIEDPFSDWLSLDPEVSRTFNGSDSQSSSQIVSYFWDFGDGTSSTDKKTTHKFSDKTLVFPLLRIKNADGFIADNFIEIHNNSEEAAKARDLEKRFGSSQAVSAISDDGSEQRAKNAAILKKIGIAGFVGILVAIFVFIFLSKKSRRKKKIFFKKFSKTK